MWEIGKNTAPILVTKIEDGKSIHSLYEYSDYCYLLTQSGCLYKLDTEQKSLKSVENAVAADANMSMFGRMTSRFFASGHTTYIENETDDIIGLQFYMDFGYIITRSKIIRINLDSGERKPWTLPCTNEDLEIIDG